jgi:hypothetical protein
MTNRIDVGPVVVYRSGDTWFAQCIEYDISAFAPSMGDVFKAFERAIAANLCVNLDLGASALDGIPPAPDRFKRMWESATVKLGLKQTGTVELGRKVPVKVREYVYAEAA